MKNYIIFLFFFTYLSTNAQTLLIDDFKTGELPLSETAVVDNVNKSVRFQSGNSILGGFRRVIYYNSTNPYGQKVSILESSRSGWLMPSLLASKGYGSINA